MFASPFTDTRPGLGLWARLATFILFGISTLTAQTGETNPEASPTEVETTATGTLTGRIVDQETGTAITNATVLVDNDESLIGISDSSGEYLILNVPAGTRSLVATKADYRTSRIENVQVIADQENVQNIPMQTLPTEATEEQVAQLEDVVFEAAQVDQVLANLELRLDADTFVNTLSAEDFSRFAATDVADAVRRV
ncbi:MAG: carboxypeptidase-like regulatory domain-containing protein, partial [Opitutales bacterium]